LITSLTSRNIHTVASSPKVSVVIPVFNKAPFIADTISSVLAQSFKDFELIIVDDCSSDGSQDVVRTFTDPRIRFYQNESNMGTAKIGNKLISLSNGEYIARVDADDIVPVHRLEKQVRYMDAHSEIGVSSGKMKTFGTEEVVWDIPQNDNEIKARMLFNIPIYQPASIIRRSLLESTGISYDPDGPNVAEDWLLWFRLSAHSNFGNLPDILNHYRTGDQNITSTEWFKFYEARTYLYRKIFSELGLPLDKVDIHFYTKPYFDKKPLSKESITEFHEWLEYLRRFNTEKKIFDTYFFGRNLKSRWDHLFYYLPAVGSAEVFHYWKLQKRIPYSQAVYYLKSLING
jgi:glycosyltransferase involved in cell wall biosynthesis